jgi:hypothetical protein
MTVLTSKANNVTIKKREADMLRKAISDVYVADGGVKPLGNASPRIYDDLTDSFKQRLIPLGHGVSYTDSDGNKHVNVQCPTSSFLKDLFYKNKKNAQEAHRKWQIDLCYLYAFDQLREDYIIKEKTSPTVDPKAQHEAPVGTRFILSALSTYKNEIEQIIEKMEKVFNYSIEKDIRDNPYRAIKSLFDFYNSVTAGEVIIIKLIGKNDLQNEACVEELINIRKLIPQNFISTTIVIKLRDICEADCNISLPMGKHKISESWNEQVDYLDKNILSNKGKKQDKDLIAEATISKARCQLIISEMNPLLEFAFTQSRCIALDLFLNHFGPAEFQNLLIPPDISAVPSKPEGNSSVSATKKKSEIKIKSKIKSGI